MAYMTHLVLRSLCNQRDNQLELHRQLVHSNPQQLGHFQEQLEVEPRSMDNEIPPQIH
jgi:hypothetical protein